MNIIFKAIKLSDINERLYCLDCQEEYDYHCSFSIYKNNLIK